MNEQYGKDEMTDDGFGEKELMEILNGTDDDLIDRRIDELLTEKGRFVDIRSIKKKAFIKLKRGKRRSLLKRVVIAAAAAVTVSTVYARDLRKAYELFIGKSTVYQTVVDGDAYYLPAELPLGDIYTLEYADMSEGILSMCISVSSTAEPGESYKVSDIYVADPNGGKKYTGGGYSIENGRLNMYFYNLPMLREFELSMGGEMYLIPLEKAESLEVGENLIMGVPQAAAVEVSNLIANVAASRTDEDAGVGIKIAVGFEDRDLKFSGFYEHLWDDYKTESRRVFINDNSSSVITSSDGLISNPLTAIGEDGTVYELKKPPNAVGNPITVFETDASPGTPLTIAIPGIGAYYEKIVDSITLGIPDEGEAIIGEEIDFIIQKAMVKSVKCTSETTAEILFELNTGVNKTVRIDDLSAYSRDVERGDTKITGNTGVLTLTFGTGIKEVAIEFSWPRFVIEGNWKIIL